MFNERKSQIPLFSEINVGVEATVFSLYLSRNPQIAFRTRESARIDLCVPAQISAHFMATE